MYFSGIADEAGANLDLQLKATRELGWKHLEARAVEVPGYPKANLHDLPDAAFDTVADKLQSAGVRVNCFGSTIMNWAKTVETPSTSPSPRRSAPWPGCSGWGRAWCAS